MNMKREYQTATSFITRFKGLMGQTQFEPLLIPNCRAVHTFGMKVPLDLVWLDNRSQVVRFDKNVPPNRIKACFVASSVLECLAGTGVEAVSRVAVSPPASSFVRDESGQALVETAFVLPVLILLVFGFVQLGLAMSEQQKLIYTANYATQVGSLTNDDLRVTGTVEEFYTVDEVLVAIENFDSETGGILAENTVI